MVGPPTFTQRAFVAAAAVAAAVLVVLLLIHGATTLFLLFGGLLLSVFFRALSEPLQAHVGLSPVAALLVVLLLLAALVTGFGWLAGPSLATQVAELQERLPEAIDAVQARLASWDWSRQLLGRTDVEDLAQDGAVVERAAGVFSWTAGMLLSIVGGVLVVFFVGVFVAAEPSFYGRGLVRLVPPARRTRAREVLRRVDDILRWWLIGRAISMAAVGVLVWAGLQIIGLPLALIFGVLAGLLDFVPYIGPWAAAIPAVLLGLLEGPQQALYVAALYAGVQAVENYLIAPIIEREVVRLPPALTLGAQVLLGLFFGLLGAALASPLVAALIVLVESLYVEDGLGDPISAEQT